MKMTISKRENLRDVTVIKKLFVESSNKKELLLKEVLFAKCFIGYGMGENRVRAIIEKMKVLGLIKERTECYEWVGDLAIKNVGVLA